MTLFRYSRPDQTGIDRVVAGLLEFSLVNREEVGGRFRIQQVFSAPLVAVQLDDGQWVGQADVILPVTGPTQGVRVRERLLPNVGSRTYTVVVPNPAPLYATDLVEVDPSTLTPSTESVTAWEAITESIGATLTATQGAASQAERSAITANASAGQAADSATFAASVAVQASATVDAVTQATTDAATSASASATSAADAAASATAADASRQATEDVAAGVPALLADVPTREEVSATTGNVVVTGAASDVDAIVAALAAQTTDGKPTGKFVTQQGRVARISAPTTLTLGYANTQAGDWATEATHEKVKLSLDILPDAGLGAALTIKGGYGVELDINVLGGGARGTVADAAVAGRTLPDAAMTALGSALTSASAGFTSADVGMPVAVGGAGTAGAALYATIASVTNATTAVLSAIAVTTVAAADAYIGSKTVSSPAAIAAGLKPGAVVFITGAGPTPEGVTQPLAASVRTVDATAGTFTISEGCWSTVTGASMNWFDVAVRLEDLVGAKVNLYGKGYQGYLLAADATDDTSKRIRSSDFPSIHSNSNGGGLFWKGIEAFGSMGHILSNTLYGDYFGLGADLHWDHWEGGIGHPVSQTARAYIWFDRYGQVNNLSISAGDRATEAAVLITGDSGGTLAIMGRFAQIRATNYQASGGSATITSGSNQVTNVVSTSLTFKVGQTLVGPGIPDGAKITAVTGTGNGYTSASPGTITMSANATGGATGQNVYGVTSDGLKLIGVSSATIVTLDTARCVAGLRVIGGSNSGYIRILNHKSLGSDISGMVIQPGLTGAPRVDSSIDYRYLLGYGIDLAAGLSSSTDIRLRGYIEGVHQGTGGASGKYAARSASTAAVLDIAGLRQKLISGLAGFIDTATVTLRGRPQARLENEVPVAGKFYQTDGAGGFTLASPSGATGPQIVTLNTSQVVAQNTTAETTLVSYTIPANSVSPGTAFRIKAGGTFDNDAAGGTLTFRVRVGGTGGTSLFPLAFSLAASVQTGKFWNVEAEVIFRGAASTTTPTAAIINGSAGVSTPIGGAAAAATNVNTSVARDLVLDSIWSVASAGDVLRCEYAHIEQLR